MKILLITQWYKPIKGAVKRMARMADHLAEKGHDVTVLTGFPSKPTGILPPKYHWKLWANETDGKVKILRTYEYPTPNEGIVKRLWNYFSFMISASIACLVLPKNDIVIVSSPSFFAGIPGLLAKKIFDSRFYFDVRDLWPDSAVDAKVAKSGSLVIKIMESLEKLYYKNAVKISTATPAIKRHLIGEGVPSGKVELLLNSTDTDFFRPQKINRGNYQFSDKDFICCYTGSMSSIQDLDTLIKAAARVKSHREIKFLFVGEGEEKERIIARANKLGLSSCHFLPQQEPAEVVKLINLSDVGLVPIIGSKIFQEAIPSKSCEYFACGKPIIASIKGDLEKIIEENNVGLTYLSGDDKEAAAAILKIFQHKKELPAIGLRARKLALRVFSDRRFYKRLDAILGGR